MPRPETSELASRMSWTPQYAVTQVAAPSRRSCLESPKSASERRAAKAVAATNAMLTIDASSVGCTRPWLATMIVLVPCHAKSPYHTTMIAAAIATTIAATVRAGT
jgi:hypothetical protein